MSLNLDSEPSMLPQKTVKRQFFFDSNDYLLLVKTVHLCRNSTLCGTVNCGFLRPFTLKTD